MRRLRSRLLLPALLCSTSGAASAELRVLYDSGETLSLTALARASGFIEESNIEATALLAAEPMPAVPDRHAVTSPSLTPGLQPRRPTGEAGKHLPRPLFLVGADDRSLRWLMRHQAILRDLGAVGLLVASKGQADHARVVELTDGLPLAAGSGETLARQFGLTHYPVLIGPKWIEQ